MKKETASEKISPEKGLSIGGWQRQRMSRNTSSMKKGGYERRKISVDIVLHAW